MQRRKEAFRGYASPLPKPLLGANLGLTSVNEDEEVDDKEEMNRGMSKQSSDGIPPFGVSPATPPPSKVGSVGPELAAMKLKESKSGPAASRKHSISSSTQIRQAIYHKIPFINSLMTEKEIHLFLATFIVFWLQQTSKKAHQARVDVDSVMSVVKEDSKFLCGKLRENRLNYGFFISKHFTKLLTRLHYHKATLDSYIISPYGYKMKWCTTNPSSIVSRHQLLCHLCSRSLDLNGFFSPNQFAFDAKTKTCLCPAHAGPGGAAAQSPTFVAEVNVFLDIIRFYKRLKNTDRSELANIWDKATKISDKDQNLSTKNEFADLCVALGEKAKVLNIDDMKDKKKRKKKKSTEEKEDPDKMPRHDEALLVLKKHADQCGTWIFTNTARKKEINKTKFLELNVFIEILLDYYWEFSEYENTGNRAIDKEYNLWKYVSFWLDTFMNMTPKELYERVMQEREFVYLKKLVAFLNGKPECEAGLVQGKNYIFINLLDYLRYGEEQFQYTLSKISVKCYMHYM